MVGMSELSWEDQQQIQEHLQQQKGGKRFPINNSTSPLVRKPKNVLQLLYDHHKSFQLHQK